MPCKTRGYESGLRFQRGAGWYRPEVVCKPTSAHPTTLATQLNMGNTMYPRGRRECHIPGRPGSLVQAHALDPVERGTVPARIAWLITNRPSDIGGVGVLPASVGCRKPPARPVCRSCE